MPATPAKPATSLPKPFLPAPAATAAGRPLARLLPLSRLAAMRLRDLRRHHSPMEAQALLHRADWLPPAERQLVISVFERGLTLGEISHLTGEPPSRVRRRVRQITRRMLTPIYTYVGSRRGDWSAQLRAVATHHFLWGRSIRQTADDLRLSYHAARAHRDSVITLYSEFASRPCPSASPPHRPGLAESPASSRSFDHAA